MNQIILQDDIFLNKKDLKVGYVYIKKEGILLLYIGKDNFDRFVFYNLASVLFEDAGRYRCITLAHYNLQVNALISLCESIMHQKCDYNQILVLKGMPKLYAEFGYVNYVKELPAWYTKNKVLNTDLPVITFSDKPTKIDTPFIKAKDLVPGELYYSGSLWRSLYLYLGRDSIGNFCWYFVGNASILMRNNFNEYYSCMDRTKSNKKVKRLIDAPNDQNACMYDDAYKLLQLNWRADLTGFNLG
jgi:hypothetical protein